MKTKKVDVLIKDRNTDTVVYEKKGFLAPDFYSDQAINIIASKYSTNEEYSVLSIIDRMVDRIVGWGIEQGYFNDDLTIRVKESDQCLRDTTNCTHCDEECYYAEKDWMIFKKELKRLMINQHIAFNTPSWCSLGVPNTPQVPHACYLGKAEDNLQSILQHVQTAGTIFSNGSGIGVNVSAIRGEGEPLSNKGVSSGVLSFLRMWDKAAGIIKSGGRNRRSAVLICMDADHRDIEGFIDSKSIEEKKAKILIENGYSPAEAYATVDFQNQNNSVVLSDKFMNAVLNDEDWDLFNRADGGVYKTVKAKKLFRQIAERSWETGDPGLMFSDRINKDNPIPSKGRINTSNPCQPANATVLTSTGIRIFDDINIGSVIWSGKEWTSVVNKVFTGVKPVYRYTTTAGYFLGTENHRIVEYGKKVEVSEAEAIDSNQGKLIFDPDERPLSPQDVIDGWVFGDGSVHKASNNLVYLCTGKDDIECLKEKYTGFLKRDRSKLKPGAWEVYTKINHVELPLTYLRKIPDRYKFGDSLKVRGFLRGLYNANGSVCGNRITLKATSFDVIEDVQEMLSSIGILSYYTTNKSKIVSHNNGDYRSRQSYDLNISRDRDLFAKLIGFDHDHKQKRLLEILNTGSSSKPWKTSFEIISKEYVGDQEVWDITVLSDDHTYWTGGMLVSNCGEIYGVDYTSCHLCAINVLKYLDDQGVYDWECLAETVKIVVKAMDMMLDGADYALEEFKEVATKSRPIGIGITNLGALLMTKGLSYGSPEALHFMAELQGFITETAAHASVGLSEVLGPCEWYEHRTAEVYRDITGSDTLYNEILEKGIRNTQVTTAQPGGTVSFVLDAETTSFEPLFAPEMVKSLSGGGTMVLKPKCVLDAVKLEYERQGFDLSEKDLEKPLEDLLESLPDKFKSIFRGANDISWKEHVDMLAAVTNNISSGASKTINFSNDATIEDIENAYIYAWKRGCKGITIYRDGSKGMQPLSAVKKDPEESIKEHLVKESENPIAAISKTTRLRPVKDHAAHIHEANITGHSFRIITGHYEDGSLCEIFVNMSKEGSTLSGIMEGLSRVVSLSIQHGVPLQDIVNQFKNLFFEPNGITNNNDIMIAKSILDYVGRWVESKYITGKDLEDDDYEELEKQVLSESVEGKEKAWRRVELDGPPCPECGGLTQRAGTCYYCSSCGSSSGCS